MKERKTVDLNSAAEIDVELRREFVLLVLEGAIGAHIR